MFLSVQAVSLIVTAATSIVAVVISVKALKQNSKMIEESTRPYITIYYDYSFSNDNHYLVLKNFGKSSGKITSFHCDYDLKKLKDKDKHESNIGRMPFKHIEGTTLVPGQSIISTIFWEKDPKNYKNYDFQVLKFEISYESNQRTFCEKVDVNPLARIDAPIKFKNHKSAKTILPVVKTISLSLQEFTEKNI